MLYIQLFEEEELVIELEVGKRFALKTRVHASTGLDTTYEIEDETILVLDDEDLLLDHPPEDGAPIRAGGDAGFEILEFEAKTEGTTLLHFRKVYRGAVQEAIKIRIIVS